MIVRTLQGDTVDALCWRHYGRTDGTVETVLEANTGASPARRRACRPARPSICRRSTPPRAPGRCCNCLTDPGIACMAEPNLTTAAMLSAAIGVASLRPASTATR